MAVLKLARDDDSTYRGIPILELRVGDPLPDPRAPVRYAVRITPDLARYLLTFNHPGNRALRNRKVSSFAADMIAGRWAFTPESIKFSRAAKLEGEDAARPHLEDGQNRLMAVTEAGVPVWFVIDFGWDSDLIYVIDRGSPRSIADAMRIDRVPNGNIAGATATKVYLYRKTVGTARSWVGLPPLSTPEAIETYRKDPAGWNVSINHGDRVYRALGSLTPTTWAAAFYIISQVVGHEQAQAFYEAVATGSEPPDSPTRKLTSPKLYANRAERATKTGDRREPIENIIRAFNAWSARPWGKFSPVGQPGFVLSRVVPR